MNRLARAHALIALRLQGKVDHHDAVFLHQTDQQHDAHYRDHVQRAAGQQQRQQGANRGRRQRRENGHRVNGALVEHAEHDVHGQHCGQNQPQGIAKRCAEGFGGALEAQLHADRQRQLLLHRLDRLDCLAQRRTGRQVEGNSRGRKLPLVVDQQRRTALVNLRNAGQRNRAAVSAGDVQITQAVRCAGKLRVHLHDHAVLVGLGKQGRDLPLTKGVIQRVGHVGDIQAQPRCSVAVNFHIGFQTLLLQIGGHVLQLRARVQGIDHHRHPLAQLVTVQAGQAELVLGAAYPVFDRQLLHRLEPGGDARHLGGAFT